MSFADDEQKSLAEGIKAQSGLIEERRKKNRRIIYVLLPLVLMGGSLVIYDYLSRIESDDIFSEDHETQRQIVEKWMHDKTILDFDVATSACTFNESRWQKYSEEERIGITLMLASYCAKSNGSEKPAVTIKSSAGGTVLATLGDAGVEFP